MGNRQGVYVPSSIKVGEPSPPGQTYEVQCLQSVLEIEGKYRIYKVRMKWRTLEWVVGKRYSEFTTLWTALCVKYPQLLELKDSWPKKAVGRNSPEIVSERCAFFEEFSNLCLNSSGLVSDPLVRSFYALSQGAPILRVMVMMQWNVLRDETERIHFKVIDGNKIGVSYTEPQKRDFKDEGFSVEASPSAEVWVWVPPNLNERCQIPLSSLPWNTPYAHNWPLKRGRSVGVVGLYFYYECVETPSIRGFSFPSQESLYQQQATYLQIQEQRKLRETNNCVCSALLFIAHQAPSGRFPGFLGVQVQHITKTENLPAEGEDWYFLFKVGKTSHRTTIRKRNNLSWNSPEDHFQEFFHPGDSLSVTLCYKDDTLTSDPMIGECVLIAPDFGTSDCIQSTPVNITLCAPEGLQTAVKRSKRHLLKKQLGVTTTLQLIGKEALALGETGWRNRLPILFIPGFASSALNVSKGAVWEGERIWLSMSKLTSEKLSNTATRSALKLAKNFGMGFDLDQNQIENTFIKYMSLEPDGVSDPPGVQVRAEGGLTGCSFLQDGEHVIATSFTYVMGPIINSLRGLGYDETNMKAAPYDWRLPFHALESRDGYFTNLEKDIEELFANTGEPVVVVCHSMGNKLFHYFLYCKRSQPGGQQWIDKYIHTFYAVGAPWLGAPKGLCAVVAGVETGIEAFVTHPHKLQFSRSLGSSPALFPVSLQYHNAFPIPTQPSYFYSMQEQRGGRPGEKVMVPLFNETLFGIPQCKHIPAYAANYFMTNPYFGGVPGNETYLHAPPVQRFVHCYGINVDTPKFYFLRWDPINNDWVFDVTIPKGYLPGYDIRNGVAYETSETKQVTTGQGVGINKYCGGDGTVPYDSLSYSARWKATIPEFQTHEIEGGEHRDIISSAELFVKLVEYVCVKTERKFEGIEDIT